LKEGTPLSDSDVDHDVIL